MNVRSETSLPPIIDTHAEVSERHTVRVHALTLRPEYADQLRREVQHLAEFQALVLNCLLRLLALFNVKIEADPIQYRSILRPGRFHATEEPAVPSFGVTNSKTDLAEAT